MIKSKLAELAMQEQVKEVVCESFPQPELMARTMVLTFCIAQLERL